MLASHLALEQVLCKHTWWLRFPYILFSISLIHLSYYLSAQYKEASAKNSIWVYSCTDTTQPLINTADRLLYKPFHLFLEVQKHHVDVPDGEVNSEYLSF